MDALELQDTELDHVQNVTVKCSADDLNKKEAKIYTVVCCRKLNRTCVMLRVFIQYRLAYVQVVTNCRYSIAQMCTLKECLPAN